MARSKDRSESVARRLASLRSRLGLFVLQDLRAHPRRWNPGGEQLFYASQSRRGLYMGDVRQVADRIAKQYGIVFSVRTAAYSVFGATWWMLQTPTARNSVARNAIPHGGIAGTGVGSP